jgi:hypothetical protein
MPDALYTFFPFTADGANGGFEALTFGSDADAIIHAVRLFREEPLAAEVLVCESDREVSREVRPFGQRRPDATRPAP